MPRLFIAINFSGGVKNRLISLQDRIRGQALKGRFSPRENLHLTLVFLGETGEPALPRIRAAVSGVKTAPFALELSCLAACCTCGFFAYSCKKSRLMGMLSEFVRYKYS
jgi:2'-5' RNA ligase